MASPSDSGLEDQEDIDQETCSCLDMILKPITRKNIIHHYIPLVGGACYTLMGVHVTNQHLLKKFTSSDPINVLLSTSLAGTCLYVYDRKHLKSVPGKQKITYSLFSAGLFNLGSVLLWAMIRSATASNDTAVQTARIGLAVGSSAFMIKTGMDYLRDIDSQVASKNK